MRVWANRQPPTSSTYVHIYVHNSSPSLSLSVRPSVRPSVCFEFYDSKELSIWCPRCSIDNTSAIRVERVIKTWRLHFMAPANLTEVVKHSSVMMLPTPIFCPPPSGCFPANRVWCENLFRAFHLTFYEFANFYDLISAARWTRLLFFYYIIIYSICRLIFTTI